MVGLWDSFFAEDEKVVAMFRRARRRPSRRANAHIVGPAYDVYFALRDSTQKLIDGVQERSDAAAREADASAASARRTTVAAVLLALVAAAVLTRLLVRSITRPLTRCLETVRAVAAGDLTARTGLTGRDEVGELARALDASNEAVREAVLTFGVSARALAGSSEELSAVSQQIAASADQAVGAVERGVGGGGAGVAQRADGGDGCGGDGGEHPGDRAERERGGEGGWVCGGGGVVGRTRRWPSWGCRRRRSRRW